MTLYALYGLKKFKTKLSSRTSCLLRVLVVYKSQKAKDKPQINSNFQIFKFSNLQIFKIFKFSNPTFFQS
jgi:hypothetical protein